MSGWWGSAWVTVLTDVFILGDDWLDSGRPVEDEESALDPEGWKA